MKYAELLELGKLLAEAQREERAARSARRFMLDRDNPERQADLLDMNSRNAQERRLAVGRAGGPATSVMRVQREAAQLGLAVLDPHGPEAGGVVGSAPLGGGFAALGFNEVAALSGQCVNRQQFELLQSLAGPGLIDDQRRAYVAMQRTGLAMMQERAQLGNAVYFPAERGGIRGAPLHDEYRQRQECKSPPPRGIAAHRIRRARRRMRRREWVRRAWYAGLKVAHLALVVVTLPLRLMRRIWLWKRTRQTTFVMEGAQ